MMIEETILGYLISCNLDKAGSHVYLECPEQKPTTYILFNKTGSSEVDHIRTATIAIQSISSSLYEAAKLNENVIAAMKAMPNNTNVYSVKLNSDYNFTNTQTKEYRYQAVFLLAY